MNTLMIDEGGQIHTRLVPSTNPYSLKLLRTNWLNEMVHKIGIKTREIQKSRLRSNHKDVIHR
ncbi:unnamed protein product [Musa acuminata subsp. burmannicoides]